MLLNIYVLGKLIILEKKKKESYRSNPNFLGCPGPPTSVVHQQIEFAIVTLSS